MALKEVVISDFSQTSSFSSNVTYGGLVTYSTPSIVFATKYFSLSGIPSGSRLDSAILRITRNSPAYGFTQWKYDAEEYGEISLSRGELTAYNNVRASILSKFNDGDRNISIKFKYQCATETKSTSNTWYSQLNYKNVKLSIEYTPPTDPVINTITGDVYGKPGESGSLDWTATNGTLNAITHYVVYVSKNGGSYYSLGTYTTKTRAMTFPEVGSYYRYYVVAVAPYGNSAAKYSGYFRSYGAPTVTGLKLDNSTSEKYVPANQASEISWTGADGAYNAITGYAVQMRVDGGEWVDLATGVVSPMTVVSKATGGLHEYQVMALGAQENSAWALLPALYTYTLPTVSAVKLSGVDGDVYSAVNQDIVLSWESANGSYNEITGFSVQRRINGGSWETLSEPLASPVTVKSNPSAGYSEYRVIALAPRGNSAGAISSKLMAYSNPVVGAVKLGGSPDPAFRLKGTDIVLSWTGTPGTYNDILSYTVFKDGVVVLEGVTGTSVTVQAHADTNGVVQFSVKAVGVYTESAVANAPLLSSYEGCKPPTSISLSGNGVLPNKPVTLSWDGADTGGDYNLITGYQVYRSLTELDGYTLLGSVNTNLKYGSMSVTSHADNGGIYYYKVVAVGQRANSSLSSVFAALSTVAYTAVTPPTSISVSASIKNPGDSVSVSWSGALSGINNPISGYEVYKSVNDGTFALIQTVGPEITSISDVVGVSGSKATYKVKALTSVAGYEGGFSGTAIVKANTPPTVPTLVTATPGLFEIESVVISWGASSDVDGNFSHYQIQRRIQTSESGWGSWTNLVVSTTERTFTDTPAVERGYLVQYQVKAHDTMGLYSAYGQTAQIKRNSIPVIQGIVYPTEGSGIFRQKPTFRIQVAPEPDGTTQTLQMSVDGGASKNYQVSAGGAFVMAIPDVALSPGAHSVEFRVVDLTGGISPAVSRGFEVMGVSYSRPLSTGTVISNSSTSHQAEILQLYEQVNELRGWYGLEPLEIPALVGNHENVVPGNIGMFASWGTQMASLQTAISQTWPLSGVTPATWIKCTAGMAPKASVVEQLRSEIMRA